MSRRSVLDIGCGYGSLTEFLRRHGLNAVGIDSDPSSIAQACRLFPRLSPEVLHVMASEQLSFADGSFDAVALRDALHHLFEEGDVSRSLGEIRRVLDPDGVLVIFDPQPNAVVRFCRRVVNHQDAECSSDQAVRLLEDHGWTIEQLTYTEAFALLLSGGYVGPNLVPSWQPVSKALLSGNRLVTKVLNGMGLGRWTLWRYVLTARPPLAR